MREKLKPDVKIPPKDVGGDELEVIVGLRHEVDYVNTSDEMDQIDSYLDELEGYLFRNGSLSKNQEWAILEEEMGYYTWGAFYFLILFTASTMVIATLVGVLTQSGFLWATGMAFWISVPFCPLGIILARFWLEI